MPGTELVLRFFCRLTEGNAFEVSLGAGPWIPVAVFREGGDVYYVRVGTGLTEASELRFRVRGKGELWVDDLLLFEP